MPKYDYLLILFSMLQNGVYFRIFRGGSQWVNDLVFLCLSFYTSESKLQLVPKEDTPMV